MEQFELRVLKQIEDYISPFEYGTEGFRDDWWHRRAGKVGDDALGGTTYLQLLRNAIEVGRAELTPWNLSDSYIGIDTEVKCREIWFFEVRLDFRRQGCGKEFARLLTQKYSDLPLIAFSEEADDFWSSIGWHYYPRKDGEKWPHVRSLFISSKIST